MVISFRTGDPSPIEIELTEDEFEVLVAAAIRRGGTLNDLIVTIIDDFLKQKGYGKETIT